MNRKIFAVFFAFPEVDGDAAGVEVGATEVHRRAEAVVGEVEGDVVGASDADALQVEQANPVQHERRLARGRTGASRGDGGVASGDFDIPDVAARSVAGAFGPRPDPETVVGRFFGNDSRFPSAGAVHAEVVGDSRDFFRRLAVAGGHLKRQPGCNGRVHGRFERCRVISRAISFDAEGRCPDRTRHLRGGVADGGHQIST